MRAPVLAASLLLALPGCLVALTGTTDTPLATRELIGTPIVQTHDHTDASQHVGSANVRFVAWDPLIPDELGTEGFAGMRILDCAATRAAADSSLPCPEEARRLAYIATDGAHAGFLIVDVSDPRVPGLVSQYTTPGGASQEAVPSWDGKLVFLNLQRAPGATDLAADATRGNGNGIQIVNVGDKANPRFESFYPVEVRGSHVMFYYEMDGRRLLFFNGQILRQGLPTGERVSAPVGDVIHVAEIVEVGGTHTLREIATVRRGLDRLDVDDCFPHDQWVEKHPLTGQHLLYTAWWDCGAMLYDVSDPENPRFLSAWHDLAPSTVNAIHFFRPDPVLRDGRVIAYSGPEIAQSAGEPGYLRAYDVTDPAAMRQIGAWRLPGEVENDMPFIFSPHNFDFNGNLLGLAHYHAGVWVLDVTRPEAPNALGYYLPHGDPAHPYDGDVWKKEPNFPIPYLPNAYEVRWVEHEGETYLLATERGTGLYVLQYTGVVP